MYEVLAAMEALKAHGLRVTPQRMAIYNALAQTDQHPSVEMIYEQVQKSFPNMSLNTVYTTLCTMENVGMIRQIEAADGLSRYDGNPRSHPHVVCRECHKVEDLDFLIKLDSEKAIMHSGYLIDDVAVYFYGSCPSCQKLKSKKK